MLEAFCDDYIDACDELGIAALTRGELVALIYEFLGERET
jgi:hypothetical protein